jgi:hypothetical protein
VRACNGGCGGHADPSLCGYCPVCAVLLPPQARAELAAAVTAASPWRNEPAALCALAAGPSWCPGIGLRGGVAARLLDAARNQPGPLEDPARLVTVQCSAGTRWRVTWMLDRVLILEQAGAWEVLMACQDCASQVRVNDRRDRIRVVHSAGCPWYRPGRVGRVPCRTVVTHRGPYARAR